MIAAVFALALAAHTALPPDVRAHIARRADCNHWAGEEPYDKARAHEIEQAETRLRCDRLDREEQRLRARHRAEPRVLKALTESHDAL